MDGPSLPIEFARESADGRITLVITNKEYQVRTLWASMSSKNLHDAKKALAVREGISDKYINKSIGFWDKESGASHGLCAAEIEIWAKSLNIDAVVWTNLKYGFKDTRDEMPTFAGIVEHLRELPHESKKVAKAYICKAPIHIDTEYRRLIQAELGWLPESN